MPDYGQRRYVRVTFNNRVTNTGGKKPRSIFLHVSSERTMRIGQVEFEALVGDEVDYEGEDVGRMHVIDKASIKDLVEYRQSLKYGTLERMPETERKAS